MCNKRMFLCLSSLPSAWVPRGRAIDLLEGGCCVLWVGSGGSQGGLAWQDLSPHKAGLLGAGCLAAMTADSLGSGLGPRSSSQDSGPVG